MNLCGSSPDLRQLLLPTVKKSETCHDPPPLRFFEIALSPLSPEIDLPPLRRGAMRVIR